MLVEQTPKKKLSYEGYKIVAINKFKKLVDTGDSDLDKAIKLWVQMSINKTGLKGFTGQVFKDFLTMLDDYTKNDKTLKLGILDIASRNGYRDCASAINDYESEHHKKNISVTQQQVATLDTINKDLIF